MVKDIFVINPPEDVPSKYVLLITRSVGMMAANHAAFYIDKLQGGIANEHSIGTIEGYLGDELVVEFPHGTMFLLVPRSQVGNLTAIEAATEDAAKEKELTAVMEKLAKEAEKDAPPKPPLHTGVYH